MVTRFFTGRVEGVKKLHHLFFADKSIFSFPYKHALVLETKKTVDICISKTLFFHRGSM